MQIDWAQTLGFLAAALTTFSFIPQVVYCWKTRDTRSISLGMYACFCLGVLFWLVYGLLVQQWPVVVANAVTLLLASSILFLKLNQKP
ncbi:SemiSWEET transporter [Limnobacter sp. 130]|jgi:MtN3 and saliva related transmembrane protein|uniref:SemiSWEET transporter n=1 Tax=unclassified Limnobacter TaxID=2630203 RepID=UPI0012F2C028|nr:SemiSWEET transporter [Limnobacter sp. 130]VWX33508.1 Sugar transporter SemiSWEET [Limnobacter sp. 130]